MKTVQVWDLPLRLFHWLLVAAVTAAIVTAEIGGNLIDWHGRLGLFVMGLVLFRLVWGFVGSTHARFAEFFPTPAKLRAYLTNSWQGLGHNPLGAFSVFGLLGLLAIQVGTGLFANDDIAFHGPLYELAGSALSGKLTGIHELAGNALIALIGLHVSAILFYAHVKKINLVRPMVTGTKQMEAGNENASQELKGGGILALLLAVGLAVAVVWFVGSGRAAQWLAPPPPPPAAAPAW